MNSSVASPEAVQAGSSISRPSLFSWHVICLLLIVIFFGAIRWRLASMPLERDEGEYAYAGQLMLQGIPPYKFAYNMKLPGTYAAYAAMMGILGETPARIHLGFLFINAITIVLIYFLANKLFDRTTGVVTAATYALLSTHQSTLGFAAHATHFVVIWAVAGLILLLRGEERDGLSLFFWSGVMFGFAFLMKQPGVFFGVFGFAYLVFAGIRPKLAWVRLATQAGVFILGCAVPFLLTCLILWRAGVFGNFWFWTVSYARQYSGLVSLKDGWDLFTYHFVPMWIAMPGIWVIALVGLSALIWHLPVRRHWFFVLGLFVFSFLGVSSGLYFRSHYFVMVLPAVALLAGIGVEGIASLLPSTLMPRAAALLVFVVAFGWAIKKSAPVYFRDTPEQASRAIYPNSPFVDAIPVSEYVQQHTSPNERIVVLGSEPEIYFYSHRISASGYIYVYALMENQPYWQKMQQQMIQEIESSRPAYLLYFNHPASWLTTMGSSRLGPYLNWATAYVKSDYELAGRVDLDDSGSRYYWGEQAKATPSRTTWNISIFKRKDYVPPRP